MRDLLVLTYDPDKPSFRYRIAPLLAELEGRGWRVRTDTLAQRRYGWRIWQRRRSLRASTVVLLHKLRLHPWEMQWVARCNAATVFDIDDATWLSQPKRVGEEPPRSASRERAFAAMCRYSALTMAGNRELAERARAAGARVEVVPTSVDASAFAAADFTLRQGNTAVWIGLPGNLQYLEPLRPTLAALARRVPGFRLRVVSSQFPPWPDVPLDCVPWRPGIETEALASADIGLMPLADDAFTRGKCAFKLLQYMAASLPCIASPVGANNDVVVDGRSGRLARTPDEWRSAFEDLLADRARREAMGAAGRERALQVYDSRIVVPRAAALLEALAQRAALKP
jgi:glycosyltransferase involved in cell wall biosynthesis